MNPVFVSGPLPGRLDQFGFTYIGLLIAIALVGVALAGTGVVWHAEARREKERELLFIGEEFRRAIGRYYERSPGTKKYPTSLDELLRDPRYPDVQRYLRKIYLDPISGSSDWELVMAPGGGIAGIFSPSDGEPIRQTNFPQIQSDFEGAARYSDWKFVYVPPEVRAAR